MEHLVKHATPSKERPDIVTLEVSDLAPIDNLSGGEVSVGIGSVAMF